MPRAHFSDLFGRGCLDPRELHELKRMATSIVLPAGRTVFREGEAADSAFGLTRGFVRLYTLLPDGRRQIVAFALPGDFLGIPLPPKHRLSADAIGETVLCRFPSRELAKFIQSSANMTRLLLEFATRELEMAQNQLVLIGNASAEERVTTFLLDWRRRLGSPSSQPLSLPMLRQDIADFLGMKLETLSRTFAKLEQKNAIRLAPKGVYLNGLDSTLLAGARNIQASG